MENTRELVLDMLMEILEKGSYSHLVIRDVLDKYNYKDSREKAFIKRTAEGTLERLIQIDHILDQFSKNPVPKMKPLIRNLLRMSVYQLLFMGNVPESAVCNEAVKLAGKRGFRGLSGYVNGVLRNIARKKDKIAAPPREQDEIRYLSVTYSMPEWLVEMWISAYGRETACRVLGGLLEEHPVTVRLKGSLGGAQKTRWLASLEKQQVRAEMHPYLPFAWRLWNTEGIKNLPGYGEGFFAVQDVSSMLAVEAAGVGDLGQEELLGLDLCAFPGGKSMYLAEKLSGRGKVIARDLSEYKASLMRDNIERMGYTNIEAQVHDALLPDQGLLGRADIVLADLPCSGLGVIGKKRDIKYRIKPENLRELETLQRQILEMAGQYVKPGGILVYSTCTINPGENEKMMEWFINNHPFQKESLSPYLPEPLKKEGAQGMLQLFPGIHETDGFFICRLKRV